MAFKEYAEYDGLGLAELVAQGQVTPLEVVDAAIERIIRGGGKILNGPMQVPGGQWIVQAMDPQGAYFALVSPAR